MKPIRWGMAVGFAVATAWSSGASAENGSHFIPDVIYGHKAGMALTFDVFQPTKDPNGAGVLFMVSGGWVSRWSSPERSSRRFTELLDRGFTVFAVRHGSSPQFKVPEALDDVRRAVRFIRLKASDYAVNPDRLGVFGGSAGGHLSLMLGTASDDGDPEATDEVGETTNRVAAVVAYFPPVDLRPITGPSDRFPALDFDKELSASVSPILHVSADDPPTLLIHGDADELVPIRNSESIHAAFEEAGVTSEFITIEGAGHGFRGEAATRAGVAMADWFEKHLATD